MFLNSQAKRVMLNCCGNEGKIEGMQFSRKNPRNCGGFLITCVTTASLRCYQPKPVAMYIYNFNMLVVF